MQYNQPYGAAADAPYVNGDPSIGLAGSIPPAASIEYPQRELVNLISACTIIPSNGDLNQLAKSVQSQLLISKNDTGTANAYNVTLVPTPNGYFQYMTVVFTALNTNTGPSTMNVNALGARAIKHRDGTDLIGGEIIANGIYCLVMTAAGLWQLVWSNTVGGASIPLTSSRTFFINTTTGHDTNFDGTSATISGAHGPFKTIQRGVNEVYKFNPSAIYTITLDIADGTYAESVTTPIIGGPAFLIDGNTTTPGNVLINSTGIGSGLTINGPNVCTVQGIKVTANTANTAGFAANAQATLIMNNNESGACASWAILANGGGAVTLGSHKFTANVGDCMACYRNGTMNLSPSSVYTITTPITISTFVRVVSGGQLEVSATGVPTFTNPGNVTGQKYNASLNGVVNSQGQGVNYFPGTSAGTTTSGGQYG